MEITPTAYTRTIISSAPTASNQPSPQLKNFGSPQTQVPQLTNFIQQSTREEPWYTSHNSHNGIDLRTSKTTMANLGSEPATPRPRILSMAPQNQNTNPCSITYPMNPLTTDPSQMSSIIFQEFQRALYFSWLANAHLNNGLQIYQIFKRISEESLAEQNSNCQNMSNTSFRPTREIIPRNDVTSVNDITSTDDVTTSPIRESDDIMEYNDSETSMSEQGLDMSQSGALFGNFVDQNSSGAEIGSSEDETKSNGGGGGVRILNTSPDRIESCSYITPGGTYKCANCNTNKTTLWRRDKLVRKVSFFIVVYHLISTVFRNNIILNFPKIASSDMIFYP